MQELPFGIDDLDDDWVEILLEDFREILENTLLNMYDHVFTIIHDEVIPLLHELFEVIDDIIVRLTLSEDTGSIFMKITPKDASIREVVKVTFSGDSNIFYTKIHRQTLKMIHGFNNFNNVANEVKEMLI